MKFLNLEKNLKCNHNYFIIEKLEIDNKEDNIIPENLLNINNDINKNTIIENNNLLSNNI